MTHKRTKNAVALLLAFAMVLSLGFYTMSPDAFARTTQSEIDALKSQKSELQSQQSDIQSKIDSLNSKQSSVIELKSALDEKNEITLMQIQNLEEQIELHETLIEQKSKEVDEAQKIADDQLQKYKAHIRNMEENGRFSYFEVLFGAASISEFLSLIDDIGDIMQADKELEESYAQSVTDLKTVKAEYEQAQADMKTRKAELVTLQAQLEEDIAAADAVILELQSDINANAEILADLEAQESAFQTTIEQKIKELEQQRKEEEAKNNAQNNGGGAVGTGSLVWPSYCTYITSRQGPRIHPISGQYKNHGGTDIGASYGSSIYAADAGVVTTSADGYNGGYGNYVIIDHGNGMTTLYAHMSSRAVSVGQSVSAGQVIGYVGSTGASTGPHLHFEMYINGSRIDPQTRYSWISFSYAADA